MEQLRAANEHVTPLNGAIARHETEVIALKLRAAGRDTACPLIEVLREEVRGIQATLGIRFADLGLRRQRQACRSSKRRTLEIRKGDLVIWAWTGCYGLFGQATEKRPGTSPKGSGISRIP